MSRALQFYGFLICGLSKEHSGPNKGEEEWTPCVFGDQAGDQWKRQPNTQTDIMENESGKRKKKKKQGKWPGVYHESPEFLFKMNFIKKSTGSHWKFYEDNCSNCLEDGMVKQNDRDWRQGRSRQERKMPRKQSTSFFQAALFWTVTPNICVHV